MYKKQLHKPLHLTIITQFLLVLLLLSVIAICGPSKVQASTGTLTVMVNANASIMLNWDNNAKDILNYVVEKKTGNGPFYKIAYISKDAVNFNDYSTSTVSQGETFSYRILTYSYSAASHTFVYDYYSNEVTFKISDIAAPTSLVATPVSNSQIDLTWSYPMNTSYTTLIERRDIENGTWYKIAVVPAGTLSYQDMNLASNKVYYYKVTALSGTTLISSSFPANNTGIKVYTYLDTPRDFSGKATSFTQIDLSWAGSSQETGYVIERRLMNEDFVPIRTVPRNTTVYHDINLIPNSLYTYRVKALYQDPYRTNVSSYSQELSVIAAPINQPGGLKAALTDYGEIELTWDCKVKFESGFEIWRRRDDSSGWAKIGTAGRQDRSYTDCTNAPGILYHYKIRSFISLNNDVSSYTAEVTAGSADIVPPDKLQYNIATSGSIILNWQDNTTNETGYIVEYRAQPDQEWTVIATLKANSTRFVDSNRAAGKKHYYRIKAVNTTYGCFSYSSELTVDASRPKLTLTMVKPLSCTRILISWSDNSNNFLSYRIERSENGGPVIEIAKTTPGEKQFLDTGLLPSTRYYYRVKAINQNGYTYLSQLTSTYTKNSVVFSDIEGLGEYETAIKDLASRNLIYPDGNSGFSPDGKMTRAELVCLVVRAFSLEKTPVGSFTDVTVFHPYYREIMTAKRYALIAADETGSFHPDEAVTREDACVLIAKTLQLLEKPLQRCPGSAVAEKYSDFNDISKDALDSVACCIGEAILLPVQGNMIVPGFPLTRMDAAMMVYLVIDRF